MKYALYDRGSKQVLCWYTKIPTKISLPEHQLEVHSPSPGWRHGDLSFHEVEMTKGSDVDQAHHVLDEQTFVIRGPKIRVKRSISPIALEDAKKNAIVEIESEVALHIRRIAPIDSYKQMVYCLKYTQARAILDQHGSSPEETIQELYPLVAADVGVSAKDMRDAAWKIVEACHEWGKNIAELEKIRRTAKAAINKANVVSEVIEIQQAIRWP